MARIHFIGIGGVGMAALALLLKADGHDVSGCDLKSGPRTRWLESEGIRFCEGHDASHVADADVVVATPAVPPDHPELAAAREAGKLRYRGEMLAEIVSSRDSVAVCGSHGKTTTSTFVAKLLLALGEDVAWAIGGETGGFPVARAGKGVLVVEADESDGTLALYRASTLVVTNCEYDHPDHFRTPADYFACFDAAKAKAKDVVDSESLSAEGWDIPVAGAHNVRNARAAIEVALRRGHARSAIEAVLPQVVSELPDRRFQRLTEGVYTDYAHHPTEMKCAISMARSVCEGRLRVLFQPHRYSRTKALCADFPDAFSDADEVVLCPVYAAFEEPVEGGSSADLYAECRRRGVRGLYLARSCEEAWRHAKLEMERGDVTLILGAGDIISLAAEAAKFRFADCEPRLKRPLAGLSFFGTGGASVGGGAARVVGMGSNMWISDLTTDEDYVKAPGSAARPGSSLGIPWMAGVPGTVGGWVKMNAGAFGHSVSELVRRVKVDGKWISAEECGFGYRTSSISGIIEDAEFDPPPQEGEDAASYLARRHHFPSRCCGSVFKNPEGDHAGRLLEAVGAKGMRVGGAYVWEGHANVIAAAEGATSSDILALAQIVAARVESRFGVRLEPEIAGLDAMNASRHG